MTVHRIIPRFVDLFSLGILIFVASTALSPALAETVTVTTADDSCENPDASASVGTDDIEIEIVEDSIPSLLYSADQTQNNDEQNARQAKDFAGYFSAYGELHHQKDMLTDTHRMDAYFTAIFANAKAAFEGKIVMDVGTGSGILATWAAKAGAKKVYAIEYTDMAHNARKLVEANGVSDIVTVIQGTVEGVKLPFEEDGLLSGENASERVVDVIISEWMGYMLIRESMLDSVLVARDRYLKKDTGLMFPSHATIFVAPFGQEKRRLENIWDYDNAMDDWHEFVDSTEENYGGVDYSVLTEAFEKEQREWYLFQSEWKELADSDILAEPHVLKTLDLMTCTHRDTRGIFGSDTNTPETIEAGNVDANEFYFAMDTKTTQLVSGLASWFTTDFKSRTDAMTTEDTPKLTQSVVLNTGPEQGYTHWGQQAFFFRDSVRVKTDLKMSGGALPDNKICGKDTTVHLKGSLEMFRTKDNTRLYKCRIKHSLEELDNDTKEVTRTTEPVEAVYSIP